MDAGKIIAQSELYHEKQDGLLCAQHALNNLLQSRFYTAVDLASIGQQLDEREKQLGIRAAHHNYDDTGFFSVQVMADALRQWHLELIPWQSERAKSARDQPTMEWAYICNLDQHWIALRRFGPDRYWFNLDSMLKNGPQFIGHLYLDVLLVQLAESGYTIFTVRPTADHPTPKDPFPTCPAETLCRQQAEQKLLFGNFDAKSSLDSQSSKTAAFQGEGKKLGSNKTMGDANKTIVVISSDDDDVPQTIETNHKKIKLNPEPSSAPAVEDAVSMEELRRRRLERFSK